MVIFFFSSRKYIGAPRLIGAIGTDRSVQIVWLMNEGKVEPVATWWKPEALRPLTEPWRVIVPNLFIHRQPVNSQTRIRRHCYTLANGIRPLCRNADDNCQNLLQMSNKTKPLVLPPLLTAFVGNSPSRCTTYCDGWRKWTLSKNHCAFKIESFIGKSKMFKMKET